MGITNGNYPSVPGFSPGGSDEAGIIRMLDGHKPWTGGDEGANKHLLGGRDPHDLDSTVGLPVTEDDLQD